MADDDLASLRLHIDERLATDGTGIRELILEALTKASGIPRSAVSLDTSLVLELGMDSLSIEEVFAAVEQKLGVRIGFDLLVHVACELNRDVRWDEPLRAEDLNRLATFMPELADHRAFKRTAWHDLPVLCTGETLVRLIAWQLWRREAS